MSLYFLYCVRYLVFLFSFVLSYLFGCYHYLMNKDIYITCSVCIVPVEVCLEDNDPGSCGNYEPKWYFEPVTGVCRRFLYGGCGGNANRFDAAEECWDRCGDSPYRSSTLAPRPTSTLTHDQPQCELCNVSVKQCRQSMPYLRSFKCQGKGGPYSEGA